MEQDGHETGAAGGSVGGQQGPWAQEAQQGPWAPGIQHESGDQWIGLVLAVTSSVFIGASFIIKKRGLRLAGSTGLRAGMGGFSYLREPTWWTGMISMIVGEAANFTAYAFAPAILVTPLGALSIIISAVLAHILLSEKLNMFGMLGCALCITGSFTIVLHAPPERAISSVQEVWQLAMQPAFLCYAVLAVTFIVFLIFYVAPTHGTTNIFVYLAICSLAGSLSVMSCKALGIAVKLTFQGDNQLMFIETHVCFAVVICCVLTQMNYLNKALDLYNTAIVSPVYYVMFTTLTILASSIMFRDTQNTVQIATGVCGFLTIVGGTFLLHTTRDLDVSLADLGRATLAVQRGSGERSGQGKGQGNSGGGILLASLEQQAKDKGDSAAWERDLGTQKESPGGSISYHTVSVQDASLDNRNGAAASMRGPPGHASTSSGWAR